MMSAGARPIRCPEGHLGPHTRARSTAARPRPPRGCRWPMRLQIRSAPATTSSPRRARALILISSSVALNRFNLTLWALRLPRRAPSVRPCRLQTRLAPQSAFFLSLSANCATKRPPRWHLVLLYTSTRAHKHTLDVHSGYLQTSSSPAVTLAAAWPLIYPLRRLSGWAAQTNGHAGAKSAADAPASCCFRPQVGRLRNIHKHTRAPTGTTKRPACRKGR